MTDIEYLTLAESTLLQIEKISDQWVDELALDIDVHRVGNMLTLTFGPLSERNQIVINLQKPLHEIWMATREAAFHYRWNGQAWQDSKTQRLLEQDLSAHASQQSENLLSVVFNGG